MSDIYTLPMLVSILSFAFAMVMTPGPNNIMMLSSGLTFGYRKTLPHLLGVMIGFPLMVLAIGFGLGSLFEQFPLLLKVLKYIGITYLLWMAWHIAHAEGGYETEPNSSDRPFTFIQAAMFQWVNPKAWIMAITSVSSFVTKPEYAITQILIIAGTFLLCGIISTNSWTLGGVLLKRFIRHAKSIQRFNITMAILIVVSILPFVFG
jgi:threonine/homoserine/homoserine lactone efflux protein